MINTSFNVRGEPIVCTPEDAYRCFMRTEMDHLVLGSHLLDKSDQPAWTEDERWHEDYRAGLIPLGADHAHLGQGDDEAAAGVQVVALAFDELVEEVPGKHQVVVGLASPATPPR